MNKTKFKSLKKKSGKPEKASKPVKIKPAGGSIAADPGRPVLIDALQAPGGSIAADPGRKVPLDALQAAGGSIAADPGHKRTNICKRLHFPQWA